MINTNNLVRCNWGAMQAIGGPPKELEPLFFSLYNFNGIFQNENCGDLLDVGDSEVFQYLLVTEENYIEARTKNISFSLSSKYSISERELERVAKQKATKEFNSIKKEEFLQVDNSISYSFKFGNYDMDLKEINTKYSDELGNLNLMIDKNNPKSYNEI